MNDEILNLLFGPDALYRKYQKSNFGICTTRKRERERERAVTIKLK